MYSRRYTGIDFFRLFFAFCVVLIHVPFFGQAYLTPIFRCAVPFFYIVSGYFLYNQDTTILQSKLLNNAKEWLLLYLKYFLIITLISVSFHLYYGQHINMSCHSFLEIIGGQGTCSSLDIIRIGNSQYGLYVLWFLLSGSYVFLFYYFCHRLLNYKFFYLLVLCSCIVMVFFEIHGVSLPRVISMSLPFITLGFGIRKYRDQVSRFGNIFYIVLFLILSYIEWIVCRHIGVSLEYYCFTPLLSCAIFLFALNLNFTSPLFCSLATLGKKHSLYIYIYHRCVFLILIIVLGNWIKPYAALMCFMLTLLFSVINDILMARLKFFNKNI